MHFPHCGVGLGICIPVRRTLMSNWIKHARDDETIEAPPVVMQWPSAVYDMLDRQLRHSMTHQHRICHFNSTPALQFHTCPFHHLSILDSMLFYISFHHVLDCAGYLAHACRTLCHNTSAHPGVSDDMHACPYSLIVCMFLRKPILSHRKVVALRQALVARFCPLDFVVLRWFRLV